MDEKATVAWKDAGEVWEAVSSRIISARFKWVDQERKREVGLEGHQALMYQ